MLESIQMEVYRTDNSRELVNVLTSLFLSRKVRPNVIPHQFIVQSCCISVRSGGVSLQITEPYLCLHGGGNFAATSESLFLSLGTGYAKVITINWKPFCTGHCPWILQKAQDRLLVFFLTYLKTRSPKFIHLSSCRAHFFFSHDGLLELIPAAIGRRQR